MQRTEHWYRVKGINNIRTYIRVIGEREDGFQIMIASFQGDYCRESAEYISRHLFEACVRTGYLIPEEPPYSTAEAGDSEHAVAAIS